MSTNRKGTKVSKSNRQPKILEPIAPPAPVQEAVQRDEKGRIKVVALSMIDWNDTCTAKGLKTKSAMIRYLHGEGYAPSGIAKFMGVIYQHVRNVLNQQLKRPTESTVQEDSTVSGDDSATES